MSQKNKKHPVLMKLSLGVFAVILVLTTLICLGSEQCSIYKLIAIDVIVLWLAIFVTYFMWALHFYNFNYGISQAEWDKIQNAKEARRKGEHYNEHDINDEPKYNPYKEETFGLPGGTVRGMIAFTLLFGAIALLIVSFDPQLFDDQQSFFFNQFEFYKTAFLMMIAFYFGSRSLKYLRGKETVSESGESGSASTPKDEVENGGTASYESKILAETEVVDEVDSSHIPKIDVKVDGNVSKVPMIVPILDPMSH